MTNLESTLSKTLRAIDAATVMAAGLSTHSGAILPDNNKVHLLLDVIIQRPTRDVIYEAIVM